MQRTKFSNNKNSRNSLMPIYLYVILREKSSASNPLSRKEIDDFLRKVDETIIGEDDRKKTVRCINTLSEYFKGSIIETKKLIKDKNEKDISVPAWYLVPEYGPNFGGSNFSIGEAALLIDMLKDSKIISSECTNALIQKIAASIGEVNSKELLTKAHENGVYKNENKQFIEIKEIAEQAIRNYQQIYVAYEIDGNEEEIAITPVKIDRIDEKYYLFAFNGDQHCQFLLEDIKYAYTLDDEADIPDDDEYLNEYLNESAGESEDIKRNKTIALDALFFNMREINHAIKRGKYLSFSCLLYEMLGKKVQLTNRLSEKLSPSTPPTRTESRILLLSIQRIAISPLFSESIS